nr:MAG TPA: hypothetical protein [Caudoviricetes sp.]
MRCYGQTLVNRRPFSKYGPVLKRELSIESVAGHKLNSNAYEKYNLRDSLVRWLHPYGIRISYVHS